VLLPPGEPRPLALLARLDGLILAGGGDIDPATYGGRQHETIYMVDADRDRTELALARRAVEASLPTLGICRGSQVLNVALGGSLIEHLPDEVGESVPHRTPDRLPTRHEVAIQAGSRLERILGTPSLTPASWHHQAVRRLAPGLEVVARAPDGVVEAFEMPAHPWLIAVQWHPELRAAEDPAEQRLFEELVHAANKQERNRT
jgi:putative glutamine amidotransferase